MNHLAFRTRLLTGLLALLVCWLNVAHAEGSRTLYPAAYPASGFRASLDWQPGSRYVGLVNRRSFLYVYAQAGEVILTGGSSVQTGANAVRTQIDVYSPGSFGTKGDETIPGSSAFSCNVNATAAGTPGYIPDRTAELAGPKSASGAGGAGTWTPCAFTAPTSGIYGVTIQPVLVSGGAINPSGSVATLDRASISEAAWEVAVRASASSTTDLNGRLFTYAFTGFTGGNSRPIKNNFYVVTADGFRYRENTAGSTGGGLDPNGFAIYANSKGFFDTFDNSPLYHDLRGSSALVDTPLGGSAVRAQGAEFPLFFSDPQANSTEAEKVLFALGIPSVPNVPVVSNNSFRNTRGGTNVLRGSGGTFTFNASQAGTYQIVISADGVNFDPENTQNKVLRGNASFGSNSVAWDGKNNNLANFPAGTIRYSVLLNAGEVHFPLVDAENNPGGGPIVTLLNPPASVTNPNIVYYDDRGYVTKNGTAVGNLNGTLCPAASPAAPSDNANLLGVDSSTTAYRNWASGGNSNTDCNATAGWGDAKALDLWSFVQSNQLGTLDVVTSSDLQLTKTASLASPPVGSSEVFTLTLRNLGPDDTTNVRVHDALPAGYTFVSATATTGTYDAGTGDWTVVTGSTPLTSGSTVTLTMTAIVNASGPYTNTAEVTASDQPDPNSTPGNNVTGENDQSSVTPVPTAPSLSVTKTSSAPTLLSAPNAFREVYQVRVVNAGTLSGTYSLTDQPGFDPDVSVTAASVTRNGGSAAPLSGSGPWTLATGATVAAGATDTYLLTVDFTVSPGGSTGNDACSGTGGSGLYNTATLNTGGALSSSSTCQATPALPDFVIAKTADRSPAVIGQPLKYTLTVTNTATGSGLPVVTDVLDTRLASVTSVTAGSGWSCAQSGAPLLTVTCTRAATMPGNTPAETAVTLTVVPLAAALPGPLGNSASVNGDGVTPDCSTGVNCATVSSPLNVPPVAANDASSTDPGVNVTFSVTGNDTDTAPGTVDTATVDLDPATPGRQTTFTDPGKGTYTVDNAGNVTFAPAPGFTAGTSSVTYTVQDNQGATSNVATISVAVPASVDLAITKAGPAYFRPGDTLSYTLTVTESGSPATGVTVTDTLPSGLTFVSASNGGTYSAATGKVSWTVGNLASGATVTLTVTGTAPTAASIESSSGPTSLVNTASVTGNETEAVTTNNTASSTAQLVYPKLTKRVRNLGKVGALNLGATFGTAGTGVPGEVLEYCIDARNYGVGVSGFVLADTVPGNTVSDLSAYGAGLGVQVTRGGSTSTRTSTGADTDGGSLGASALSVDFGVLASGETVTGCFRSTIN